MSMTDKEKLAQWMLSSGFATGHGETMEDLLEELTWQIEELRMGPVSDLIVEGSDA